MNFKELDRGELLAVVGGIVVGISLFLEWFTLGDKFTVLNSCKGPNTACSGWQSLTLVRFLLLAAAVAPAVLAWIIIRGHALSWPRGELTAVISLAALTFTVFVGLIDKPGSPQGQISVSYGFWIAVVGGVLILIGSIARSRENASRRKPPGVL